LIDWCLRPTLAIFQPYRGMTNFYINDCIDDADVRQNFYNVNNLCNLFTNVAGETILKVLKDIDLNAQI
jgi:hypothetical protein